jgi:hypothetical protein
VSSGPGGYTCRDCGMFVWGGGTHICARAQQSAQPPSDYFLMVRIATALERIADALEADG